MPEEIFGQDSLLKIGIAVLGSIVAVLISAACFLPGVRRALARILPLQPDSFVHATALATALIVTLSCFIPLIVSSKPPLLQLEHEHTAPENGARLRGAFYGLIWAVPAALIAVGYPRQRNFHDVVDRLAIAWPSRRQVMLTLLTTIGLFAGMSLMDHELTWVWLKMGWSTTDSHATWTLFGYALGPFSAVVASVSAGVGEEVVFRGVLQPRIGLAITGINVYFRPCIPIWLRCSHTSTHPRFHPGYIRKASNTTTSAIVHSGYDFCVFITAYFMGR